MGHPLSGQNYLLFFKLKEYRIYQMLGVLTYLKKLNKTFTFSLKWKYALEMILKIRKLG